MKWILCLLCLVAMGCGNSDASEAKESHCVRDAVGVTYCGSYKSCMTLTEDWDDDENKCSPIEEVMGQRVAYCWEYDMDRGDGPEVDCQTSMKSCKFDINTLAGDGPLALTKLKVCYVVRP